MTRIALHCIKPKHAALLFGMQYVIITGKPLLDGGGEVSDKYGRIQCAVVFGRAEMEAQDAILGRAMQQFRCERRLA